MAAKFENFKISPSFPINFRKSHPISKNYLKSSKFRGLGVPKDLPCLNRVKDPAVKTCINQLQKQIKDDIRVEMQATWELLL